MKTTVKGVVHATKDERYDTNTHELVSEIRFSIYPFEMTGSDRAVVGEQEFMVDIPDDFDIRAGLISNLEEERRKLQAEFGKRINEINAQIQSLLAIEA